MRVLHDTTSKSQDLLVRFVFTSSSHVGYLLECLAVEPLFYGVRDGHRLKNSGY